MPVEGKESMVNGFSDALIDVSVDISISISIDHREDFQSLF